MSTWGFIMLSFPLWVMFELFHDKNRMGETLKNARL
jgi:hypothetical protein